jgi:hypothetical protein
MEDIEPTWQNRQQFRRFQRPLSCSRYLWQPWQNRQSHNRALQTAQYQEGEDALSWHGSGFFVLVETKNVAEENSKDVKMTKPLSTYFWGFL